VFVVVPIAYAVCTVSIAEKVARATA
jgi:hypothetical protein